MWLRTLRERGGQDAQLHGGLQALPARQRPQTAGLCDRHARPAHPACRALGFRVSRRSTLHLMVEDHCSRLARGSQAAGLRRRHAQQCSEQDQLLIASTTLRMPQPQHAALLQGGGAASPA